MPGILLLYGSPGRVQDLVNEAMIDFTYTERHEFINTTLLQMLSGVTLKIICGKVPKSHMIITRLAIK